MTPTEALARIAALLDNSDRTGWDIETEQIRAILAKVTPDTGVTLDRRDAAFAAHAIRYYIAAFSPRPDPGGLALAARLEAAS